MVYMIKNFQEDILSLWNRTANDTGVTSLIRDTFRQVLNLLPETTIELFWALYIINGSSQGQVQNLSESVWYDLWLRCCLQFDSIKIKYPAGFSCCDLSNKFSFSLLYFSGGYIIFMESNSKWHRSHKSYPRHFPPSVEPAPGNYHWV